MQSAYACELAGAMAAVTTLYEAAVGDTVRREMGNDGRGVSGRPLIGLDGFCPSSKNVLHDDVTATTDPRKQTMNDSSKMIDKALARMARYGFSERLAVLP